MGLSKADMTWLSQHFGENVVFDEPMHRHTSFRIGGAADAFVTPQNLTALQALVNWTRQEDIPCFILGKGTNVLVRDNGIRGVVVCLESELSHIRHARREDNTIRVTAMAGAGLQRLCRYAIDNGFSGLNFAVGIPGSVGGAVMMNAGTADGCMADVVEALTILAFSGDMKKIEKKHMHFAYRHFRITDPAVADKDMPFIIVEAEMMLGTGDPDTLKTDADKKLQQRKKTQPIHKFSPGCIFKNPAGGLPAGRMIDEAGLKGKRIGDAQVSDLHANYIINHGKACAADVMALMHLVAEQVQDKFNVRLEPEVIIVGE